MSVSPSIFHNVLNIGFQSNIFGESLPRNMVIIYLTAATGSYWAPWRIGYYLEYYALSP